MTGQEDVGTLPEKIVFSIFDEKVEAKSNEQ